MQEILRGVAYVLQTIGENRDPYTAKHQLSVACIAKNIGQEVGLTTDDLDILYLSGLLHDIGKITIPISILVKPKSLSYAEYLLIQEHCQAGYDILKKIPFDSVIKKVALQHHERIDGSGYPNGLLGANTFYFAKIIAVADTVDAMISTRAYRISCGIKSAIEAIDNDKLYDSSVVKHCLNLFKRGKLFNGIAR